MRSCRFNLLFGLLAQRKIKNSFDVINKNLKYSNYQKYYILFSSFKKQTVPDSSFQIF